MRFNRPKSAVRPSRPRLLRAAAAVAATVAVAGCASSSKSGAAGGSSTITIGLLTTLTGPAAANFVGNLQGAQARFDLQNAQGGVNGHQIRVVGADDQTSVQGATTGMAQLIQQKRVFGVIDLSDFAVNAYQLPQQQGVPVVGFPTDGPEWGRQPNTNMISIVGNVPPNGLGSIVDTLYPNAAKLLGATDLAALALADEQASIQGAKSFVKAARASGIKVGYENYSVPIGTTNAAPIVLGMKQANVDGFDSNLLNNTNFAILTSARQQNLVLKAAILASGYGQAILDQPAAVQAGQGAIFEAIQRPVEEPNAATRTEQAAFAKYTHFSGVPSIGWTSGWVAADLWIDGLKAAGKNPIRAGVLKALHDLKGYTANGLLPLPLDLSLADFGKAPRTECDYFTKLQGQTFVPLNGGKPVCGKTLGTD